MKMRKRMNTITPKQDLIISRDPETMGGTPVFAGTRVPVQALIDILVAGHNIADFKEGFPRVTDEQIAGLLRGIREIVQTARI